MLVDDVGLTGYSSLLTLTLSPKKLVTKTTTVAQFGDDLDDSYASECGDVSTADSDYAHGVYLSTTDCYYDETELDLAIAVFRFTLPAALRYGNLSVVVNGFTPSNTPLYLFGDPGDLVGIGTVRASRASTVTTGTVRADTVRVGRSVSIWAVSNSVCDCSDTDYDINSIGVRVTYEVLQ